MDQHQILRVDNLATHFNTFDGVIRAVDGISFHINRGDVLGVVGESGCGKSVTSKSILQLVSLAGGRMTGDILYRSKEGQVVNVAKLNPKSRRIREIRGKEIAMIFQEPMRSLNPVYTVGEQIVEMVRFHLKLDRRHARERAIEMLDKVGIAGAEKRVDAYPHEFSGGMRQRAMIAIALSCDPSLLIADEPTTALDVTIEAQILHLLKTLQKEAGLSIMFITHDLGVIRDMADRVMVMYAGKIVEIARKIDIFTTPRHPYTIGLLNSIPRIGQKKKLIPIKGSVPELNNLPKGCNFAPRCPKVMDRCLQQDPETTMVSPNHGVNCWLYDNEEVVAG